MTINLGSIQMPLTAATKTFAILAKRGAGKSYAAAVLAEEFHRNRIPFVVFDPIDVWWGLRLHWDGQRPGLPVVVFGQEHADLPLTPDMGPAIAAAVVQHNVTCVLSTFGMPKRGQRKLIAEFAEELLRINTTPRHVFIEEAHEFVPQRVTGEMGATFNAVSNLVVMGRNRGLGVTLINQRAATLNKDVLTQIDTLIALRNTAPQDRAALREWVEHHAAEGDFAAFLASLPSLPTGEGWLWSPEFLGVFERIHIRPRRTFHPDREKLDAQIHLPTLDQADLSQFIQQFQRQLKAPAVASPKAPARAAVAQEASLRAEYEAKLRAKDQEIAALRAKLTAIRDILDDVTLPAPDSTMPKRALSPAVNQGLVDLWAEKLGGQKNGAARILRFLADKYPITFTRSQLALAVGMTARGGSYNSYLSTLLRNRMIVERDGRLTLSPDLVNQ